MTSPAEQRLLQDLRAAGYETRSIAAWLFEKPQVHLGAGEILVDHLRSTEDEKLVQQIAKVLSHREFAFAVPALIARLGEVDKALTKSSLAGALLAIGVGGHEREIERLLAEGCSTASDVTLLDALRRSGADVSKVERLVLARERRWSGRLFAALLLAVAGVMAVVAVAAARSPSISPPVAGVVGAWALLCAALGLALWWRSSWARPVYVVWVVFLLAVQTYYLALVRPIGRPLLVLVTLGAVVAFGIVGRYLFRQDRHEE